jgi:23S rRNA pseudouridine1911/1915/1917 synthase
LDSILDQNSRLTFSVTDDEAGERLDSFLAARVQDWSRARLQRLIEDADVLVNGRSAKSSYKTRAHDEIEIRCGKPRPTIRPDHRDFIMRDGCANGKPDC